MLGWSLVLCELGGLQGLVPLAEASWARVQKSNILPDYSEFSLHTCCPSLTEKSHANRETLCPKFGHLEYTPLSLPFLKEEEEAGGQLIRNLGGQEKEGHIPGRGERSGREHGVRSDQTVVATP